MMLSVGLGYNNLLWLGRAGSLHRPPVLLTPGMIGHFEDSVYEICKNLEIIDSCVSFKEFLSKFTHKVERS